MLDRSLKWRWGHTQVAKGLCPSSDDGGIPSWGSWTPLDPQVVERPLLLPSQEETTSVV